MFIIIIVIIVIIVISSISLIIIIIIVDTCRGYHHGQLMYIVCGDSRRRHLLASVRKHSIIGHWAKVCADTLLDTMNSMI